MPVSPGKPCRVLIIVENLPLPFDRRVWQEANALRNAGYFVTVICPKGRGFSESYEILDGIHIYRHPHPVEADTALKYFAEYAIALLWEFALAIRIAFTRGFDVIQACNPPDTIFLIGRVFRFFGKRFIFDHHDINPELYEAKFERRDVWYRVLLRLERWTYATADASIATNESYRRIAIERGGMDPERVFVVRSGPDLTRVQHLPPRQDLKRGREHLVAYVGVIGGQEGLDLLLQAVAHMRYKLARDDTQFVIIGDGTELPALIQLRSDLGLIDQVDFVGRIPEKELWEILGTADVCVNPDRANAMNDQSTMNKVLEYMALGKPIVQFDLTEGRRSAGGASLYASPNDICDFAVKICALLDDPTLRQKMGAEGRRRIELELAWHHQIPALLNAYAKAME